MSIIKDWPLCYLYYGEIVREKKSGSSLDVDRGISVFLSINTTAIVTIILIAFSRFMSISSSTAFIILGFSLIIPFGITELLLVPKIFSVRSLSEIEVYLRKYSTKKIKKIGIIGHWSIVLYTTIIFICVPVTMALLGNFKD